MDRDIESMYQSILDKLEVNFLFCKSKFVIEENLTIQECEEYHQKHKGSKLEINNVYFGHDIVTNEDGKIKLIEYGNLDLAYIIRTDREKIKNKLLDYVNNTDNKYELNDFFKKLNDRIKSGLSYSNYQSWVDENFKNNNKSNIFLYVQDRYEPIPFLSVNLESYVGYFIEQEFAFRHNLIFTLLIDLHEIYSEHLFFISNCSLPSTPTKLNKTDITEVVYLLEKYGKFEKISDFKSTILQMLQISNDDYSKTKSNIVKRKGGKFQFIEEVLKKEGYEVYLP
jgi:hypothetical protein